MQVPLSWLREFVSPLPLTPDLTERLTVSGLEVSGVQRLGAWWSPDATVVARIVSIDKHPNADKLVLVTVDAGKHGQKRIVTGAPNMRAHLGQTTPTFSLALALEGASFIDAKSPTNAPAKVVVKRATLRGVESEGVLLSERELGLSENHDGVLELAVAAAAGTPLLEVLDDEILTIEITPDAARCLNIVGVAREVAALTKAKLTIAEPALPKSTGTSPVLVEVAAPQLCPRYMGVAIRGVKVGPSPHWMQQRLSRAGMRPINNLVDITNYVLLEWGQPLHAFDLRMLESRAAGSLPKITVRAARSGEAITTLDGTERKLAEGTLLITDAAGPLAVAGVMGGRDSEIRDDTTDLFIESACFDGLAVRRSSQQLKLSTESSYRFSRGIPMQSCPLGLARAVELVLQCAGGEVASAVVDICPTPPSEKTVYLTASQVHRLLGVNIPLAEVIAALKQLQFGVDIAAANEQIPSGHGGAFGLSRVEYETVLRCTVPWYRGDISIPADLVEEIARVIGFDRIAVCDLASPIPPAHRDAVLETEDRLRQTLVGAGLSELITYPITTPAAHEKIGRGTLDGEGGPFVTLANSLSSERTVMRRTMLCGLMETLIYNRRFSERAAVFEIGRVYLPEFPDSDGRPREQRRLSIGLCGPRGLSWFKSAAGSEETFDFLDLKGVLELLQRKAGIAAAQVSFERRPGNGTFGPWCATVRAGDKVVGAIGELDSKVLRSFGLKAQRVCAAELLIDPLVREPWTAPIAADFSRYPMVVEDLAFIVDQSVTVTAVERAMHAAGGKLLLDAQLFDLFAGPPLAEGKKSLAFKVRYQSAEATLSEQQIVTLRQAIVDRVSKELGGVLRTA